MASTTDPLIYTEQGTFIVKWSYDDGHGNTSTQDQVVIIDDVTPPVPNMAELPTVTGQCSVEIPSIPTASDNCSGDVTGTTSNPLSYSDQGTYIVTWMYDDGNGNVSSQNQTVIVKDTIAPEIALSDPICVPFGRGRGNMANKLVVSAEDNCSGVVPAEIMLVEIFNQNGELVRGKGFYEVIGQEIYVNTNANGWSIWVTAIAEDEYGNATTARMFKPLERCRR